LLGAAALGDIGFHFPDTDEQYLGISSLVLLQKVGDLLQKNNFTINNIDSTLILQAPKIAPYIIQMRTNIGDALRLDSVSISVKATTNEGLGFEGESHGAAAHAVATIDDHN
jgi:2-C-methyl-D-erythritol 2,4-cyclodiphosphate synthase